MSLNSKLNQTRTSSLFKGVCTVYSANNLPIKHQEWASHFISSWKGEIPKDVLCYKWSDSGEATLIAFDIIDADNLRREFGVNTTFMLELNAKVVGNSIKFRRFKTSEETVALGL